VTLAELFLRLGLVLVAWMAVLAHCTWLATLRLIPCQNDVQPWFLTLLSAPLVAGLALILPHGRRIEGIASTLRLPGLLLVPLVPLALVSLVEPLRQGGVCGIATGWQAWWAPVQLFVLVLIVASALRAWRGATR